MKGIAWHHQLSDTVRWKISRFSYKGQQISQVPLFVHVTHIFGLIHMITQWWFDFWGKFCLSTQPHPQPHLIWPDHTCTSVWYPNMHAHTWMTCEIKATALEHCSICLCTAFHCVLIFLFWTRGKKFSVKMKCKYRDGPEKSTENRKSWNHKKTILLLKSRDKERLEHYSTSVSLT